MTQGRGPGPETKALLGYFEKMQFAECRPFAGDIARRAAQLVQDINSGEIVSALHLTGSRRFRSFKDEGLIFVVRTR